MTHPDNPETPDFISWDELPFEMQREVLRRRQENAGGAERAKAQIRFYCRLDHQAQNFPPVPGVRAMPQWLKDTPKLAPGLPQPHPVSVSDGVPEKLTVRRCPGVIDYLNTGYMLPMWADLKMTANRESYAYEMMDDPFGKIAYFAAEQTPEMPARHPEASLYTLNMTMPWAVVTPPGWSTLVLPWEYDLNPMFDVIPGILDTDLFHQMSVVIRWNATDGDPHLLKAGEPVAHLIPFRRTDFDAQVIQDAERFAWYYTRGSGQAGLVTPFSKPPYRKRQHQANKGWAAPAAPGDTRPEASGFETQEPS